MALDFIVTRRLLCLQASTANFRLEKGRRGKEQRPVRTVCPRSLRHVTRESEAVSVFNWVHWYLKQIWGSPSKGKRRVNLGEMIAMSVMFSKTASLGCTVAKNSPLKSVFLGQVSSFPKGNRISTGLLLGLDKTIHVKYQTLMSLLVVLLLSPDLKNYIFLWGKLSDSIIALPWTYLRRKPYCHHITS